MPMPPARHWDPPRVPRSALVDAEPPANAQHSQHRKDCPAASNGPAVRDMPPVMLIRLLAASVPHALCNLWIYAGTTFALST